MLPVLPKKIDCIINLSHPMEKNHHLCLIYKTKFAIYLISCRHIFVHDTFLLNCHQAYVADRHVAHTLNVSHKVVQWMWNRFQHKGNVSHLHRGGLSRCTTHAQDPDIIVVQTRCNHFQTATSTCKIQQMIRECQTSCHSCSYDK
jgi:hypothetical protein